MTIAVVRVQVPPRVQKTLQLEGFLIVLTDLKYGGHLRIFI